ncbi:MAG: phenylalanine--tRNA ligase subunit beta [bacterium]|nr:phenylalanine--tRNA ligase subunit beta [bacterium]
MKTTLSWVQNYLTSSMTLKDVHEAFDRVGLCVEGLENPGEALATFTVAQVIDAKQHPNADRLKVCRVNTGSEEIQVVCGAPNARTGIKVVLARPGDTVPTSGVKLKRSEIRGEVSEGMMCSAQELGLGEDHDGIIELPDDAPVGGSFVDYQGLNDSVFDLEITPNRGDALGAYGLARDLAATGVGGDLKSLDIKTVPGNSLPGPSVHIDSEALSSGACPYFAGRVIRNVKNCESPDWLQNRLRLVGLRPISALVDVTNYISYDLGRPMHAFDLNQLKGDITVRLSKGGETLEALDEKTYTLKDGMTVVCDEKNPQGLAGIMGGARSGCTLETTDIFLESALFDAVRTAKTGRALGINSDSRYRFERGVDAGLVLPALEKATQLILDLCGGDVGEIVSAGELPEHTQVVTFDPARSQTLGGAVISTDRCEEILTSLGFKVEKNSASSWSVGVPSWRHDIDGPADLVEEILRIEGYDKILPELLPALHTSLSSKRSAPLIYGGPLWAVRRGLVARGVSEAVTWSFVSESQAELFGSGGEHVSLENPISAELSTLRPCLVPGLLLAAGRNDARGAKGAALFELGSVYQGCSDKDQSLNVAALRFGAQSLKTWRSKEEKADAFMAKEDALAILKDLGVDVSKVKTDSTNVPAWYHPGRSGRLMLGPKNVLAVFGELHPRFAKPFDLDGVSVSLAEVFVDNAPRAKSKGTNRPALEVSPYPAVDRDFAFVLDQSVHAQDVVSAVKKVDPKLIRQVSIFDVYEGKHMEAGKKSLALSIVLESLEKTLTDEEINGVCTKVIASVESAVGGVLRG